MKFTWKAKSNDGWTDSPITALGKPMLFDTQELGMKVHVYPVLYPPQSVQKDFQEIT